MNEYKILDQSDLGALASPFRRQLLQELSDQPDSAANIARRHEMSRQRIGYHMRELEKYGYLEVLEERQQRGFVERIYRVRSFAYVHSSATEPGKSLSDKFSWASLLNLMASGLSDLISIRRLADQENKRIATLGLEAELTFPNPTARRAFATELLQCVESLVKKHNQPGVADGRHFRLVVGAYPVVRQRNQDDEDKKQTH